MSHSTRVRGLKYKKIRLIKPLNHVALYTSAWIEIMIFGYSYASIKVALYTSAWIEIFVILGMVGGSRVALYTSAWIEIYAAHVKANG